MNTYTTLKTRFVRGAAILTFESPANDNSITPLFLEEFQAALAALPREVGVLVLEGSPHVFCTGADLHRLDDRNPGDLVDAETLYRLWTGLMSGPYITIAHVRGRAMAGGIGFVASCDLVIAEETARFSLPELLFGLYPACVMPFLIRKIGFQRTHAMTLLSETLSAETALSWGLVDKMGGDSARLLDQTLRRLERLDPSSVSQYKAYANGLCRRIGELREDAVRENRKLFSDAGKLALIKRYSETGLFPWEA